MQFDEVLRRRKMVRNYNDEAVPREVVERIVARGRKAPSGGFSQGLRIGMPDDLEIVGVVAIGHPAPEPERSSRRRGWKPLEEVVRWEAW